MRGGKGKLIGIVAAAGGALVVVIVLAVVFLGGGGGPSGVAKDDVEGVIDQDCDNLDLASKDLTGGVTKKDCEDDPGGVLRLGHF